MQCFWADKLSRFSYCKGVKRVTASFQVLSEVSDSSGKRSAALRDNANLGVNPGFR